MGMFTFAVSYKQSERNFKIVGYADFGVNHNVCTVFFLLQEIVWRIPTTHILVPKIRIMITIRKIVQKSSIQQGGSVPYVSMPIWMESIEKTHVSMEKNYVGTIGETLGGLWSKRKWW